MHQGCLETLVAVHRLAGGGLRVPPPASFYDERIKNNDADLPLVYSASVTNAVQNSQSIDQAYAVRDEKDAVSLARHDERVALGQAPPRRSRPGHHGRRYAGQGLIGVSGFTWGLEEGHRAYQPSPSQGFRRSRFDQQAYGKTLDSRLS